MGIPTNIKTLLSGDVVEWARIEFKETWDADASLKTICAFANDMDNWGGGYLVIGVRDAQGRPDSLPGVNSLYCFPRGHKRPLSVDYTEKSRSLYTGKGQQSFGVSVSSSSASVRAFSISGTSVVWL